MIGLDAGMTPAEIFQAQRALAPSRRKSFDRTARQKALLALRDMVLDHQEDIAVAMAADFGKAATEVALTEILPVLQEISHARKSLRGWMRPRRVWPTLIMLGTAGRILPEPKGVCLIIAPWNYPVNLALGPLVSALAAGNSVILKPSELTPNTSALLARLIGQTFAPDLVAVLEGGPEMSTALLELPFDHIFFTGSPAVGKIVMAAAAKTLASVTLELGGKSPVIVGPGANLARAAKWICWGKFLNAGQTCVAPDHVFVHTSVQEPFVAAMRAAIDAAYGKDPRTSQHFARIVNRRNWGRVTNLLEEAKLGGAQVLMGGESDEATRYLAPTLLAGTRAQMAISREEIFGPVLPIIAYEQASSVVDQINAGEKPLALYVFGDNSLADTVTSGTSSGSVGVNLTVLPFSHGNLPFGGIGNSGLGAAHGHAGFKAFSHEKPVLKNLFSLIPLVFPPYTGLVKRLAKLIVGISK